MAFDDPIGADFGRVLVQDRHAGIRAPARPPAPSAPKIALDHRTHRSPSAAARPTPMTTRRDRACDRCARARTDRSPASPSSSAVRSRSVCSRQLCTSVAPSNTPRTMLVLPTSMASSIGSGFTSSRFKVLAGSDVLEVRRSYQVTSPATMRSIRSPTRTSSAPRSSIPAVTPLRHAGGATPCPRHARAASWPARATRQASRIASNRPSSRSS